MHTTASQRVTSTNRWKRALGSLVLATSVGCTVAPGSGDEAGVTAATDPSSNTGDSSTTAEASATADAPDDSTGATSLPPSDSASDDSDDSDSDTTTGATEDGWVLVWSDEFDGSAIDSTHWEHEVNCWGGGNGEQQCYTNSPQNAFVQDGQLHIVAARGDTHGPAVNDDDPAYDPADTSGTLPYSSARLRTRDLADWKFGRFEIRARLPFGQGTWPAIWMLPTARVYGGWAASGEIDIMEAVNLRVGGENRVHGTLHYGSYWPANVYSGAETTLPGGADPAADFHDYAVEWELGEIRFYVDGHHYATQRTRILTGIERIVTNTELQTIKDEFATPRKTEIVDIEGEVEDGKGPEIHFFPGDYEEYHEWREKDRAKRGIGALTFAANYN